MGTLDVPETDAENSIDTGSHEAREGKQVEEVKKQVGEVRERMDLEEEELINAQESRESVATSSETAREDTAQDRLFVDILSLVKPPRPHHPPPGHHHQHHGGQQHQDDNHPGNHEHEWYVS